MRNEDVLLIGKNVPHYKNCYESCNSSRIFFYLHITTITLLVLPFSKQSFLIRNSVNEI